MATAIILGLAGCILAAVAAAYLLRAVLPAWRDWLRTRSEWRRLDSELAGGRHEPVLRDRAGSRIESS